MDDRASIRAIKLAKLGCDNLYATALALVNDSTVTEKAKKEALYVLKRVMSATPGLDAASAIEGMIELHTDVADEYLDEMEEKFRAWLTMTLLVLEMKREQRRIYGPPKTTTTETKESKQ